MIAFDLLYLNGYDLRKLPLIERKSHLKRLIEKTATQFSDHFDVLWNCLLMPLITGERLFMAAADNSRDSVFAD